MNFITLSSVTLVLCFALCTAHLQPEVPSVEKPESQPPAADPPTEEPLSVEPPLAESLSAESPFAESPFAESPFSESLFAESPFSESLFAESPFAESPFAESSLSESLFAEFPLSESLFAESPFSESVFAESPFSNAEGPISSGEGFFKLGGGGGLRQQVQGHLSAAFSSFFADIQKGSLRGSKTITMHEHISKKERDSVKEVCSHTEYPEVCLSTVVPFLNRNCDLNNILEAAIKACSFQANFTLTVINKHMESSPEMANALFECKKQYTNAFNSLQQALDALHSKDFGSLTITLGSVMADCSSCESGFQDQKVGLGRGEGMIGMVGIMASNCIKIAALIPQ